MRQARPTPSPLIAAGTLLLIGSALLLSSAAAHAQWKWKDGKGQVHVSDLPPPREVSEKDILQRPTATTRTVVVAPGASASGPAPATPGVAPRAPQETELEKRRKAAEQEQAAKGKVEDEQLASQRRENCGRARSHLSALEGGMRIARMNEKGEREVLDDKGRADEMRRTREVIASDCR